MILSARSCLLRDLPGSGKGVKNFSTEISRQVGEIFANPSEM